MILSILFILYFSLLSSLLPAENLQHLDLSHNPLGSIPVETGNLELLQELGQWEVTIAFLASLTHLDASHCLLTEWPAHINLLSELTYLNLSHNSIKIVPSECAELSSLETLLLTHCGAEEITSDIYGMQRLQVKVADNFLIHQNILHYTQTR